MLQGPPGPPGTCSYTEVSLVKGVRDISTSLKESVKNLTKELMDALGRIELAVCQATVPVPSTLVKVLLPLSDSIIFVNLESLVDGKTTIE